MRIRNRQQEETKLSQPATNSALPDVGFLGPGAMGSGMVFRLLEAGYQVRVWARNPQKLKPFTDAGATIGTTLEDVVGSSDIVLGCLLDTAVIRETYLGPGGIVESARPGQLFAEHATFDPDLAREILHALGERGANFADAPVSGGPRGAREGTLVSMIGADAPAMEALTPILDSYCSRLVHIGGIGSGLKVKLINQLLVSTHALAAAEAAALVHASGIDPEVAHNALMGGWAASTMLDMQLPAACAREFDGGGASIGGLIEVQRLVAALMAEADVDSALLDPTRRAFDTAVDAGHGGHSLAALVTNYAANNPAAGAVMVNP
ncbi:NAD(P)-dependent oxidoreductase [Arthrobacter sp.]|uniref:NAD(P)-dependent oxidoreductase n=1 Tax=Arthrobacter sp. TaxID=1667 RepID=UPI003A947E74